MSLRLLKSIRKYFRNSSSEKRDSVELTEIEKKILEKISIGKSYHTIADEVSISKDEVQKKIRIIYEKIQRKSLENE